MPRRAFDSAPQATRLRRVLPFTPAARSRGCKKSEKPRIAELKKPLRDRGPHVGAQARHVASFLVSRPHWLPREPHVAPPARDVATSEGRSGKEADFG